MPARPPLDSRDLAALLAQLREGAQQALPGWTPAPEGDAGTALHRLFARYVEIALQRLNGVPDKVLLTFLDTMGVSRLPPAPARVPLVFTLVPGAGPTLVPAGSPAAAPAGAGGPEVTFETEQDLLVLPARLVAAQTVDPVWDRTSDLADLVTVPAPASAPPAGAGVPGRRDRSVFVGDTPLPHALHVTSDGVLDVAGPVELALTFAYRGEAPAAAVRAFLRSLVLTCRGGGAEQVLSPAVVFGTLDDDDVVSFQVRLRPVDVATLDGIGLPTPLTGRWLRLGLPAPYPDADVPAGLRLRPRLLDVEAEIAPDALLAGTAVLDPSRDFLPFGERPQVGDALLIRSDEAFARPMGLAVSVDASAGTAQPGLTLVWECLTAEGWSAVTATSSSPEVDALTARGGIGLTLPGLPLAEVGGTKGRWVRVRIAAGGYGAPAGYEPVDPKDSTKGFRLKAGTGNLAPPRLASLRLSYVARTVPSCVVAAGDLHQQVGPGEFDPFPAPARLPAAYADPDPAFYLGFDGLAPQQVLTLYVDVPAPQFTRPGLGALPAGAGPGALPGGAGPGTLPGGAGPGALPAGAGEGGPRLRWEYFDGTGWRELTVFDGTRELTASGAVSLVTPIDLAPLSRFAPPARVWLRIRSATNDLVGSPRVSAVHTNAVPAIAAVTVAGEVLGSSSGRPGQVLATTRAPVQPGQRLLVAEPQALAQDEAQALAAQEGPDAVVTRTDATGAVTTWVRWHEVPNLIASGPTSRHYTLDHTTGTVRFGDGLHGLIPPPGAANLSISYRCGGGAAGNLPAGTIVQLGSPQPAISAVTNPVAADGGADAEPLDAVRERGAHLVRHRGRAIAADDVEWLVRQAAGIRVARAVCLPNLDRAFAPNPGWLSVLVIPAGENATPRPTPQLVLQVGDDLAARSSLSLSSPGRDRINVFGPAYLRVTVEADVVPRVLADADLVTRRIVAALGTFFHPVSGGPQGTGWALGRAVYGSEVAQVLAGVEGVSYVKSLVLHPNLVQRRLWLAGSPAPVTPVLLPAGSSVRSPDGAFAGQLARPVPARTVADRIDVTGFREGDQVTVAVDLTVLAGPATAAGAVTGAGAGTVTEPGPGAVPAALAAGRLATAFPRGSVVLIGGGARRTRLRRALPADPAGPGTRLPVLLDVEDPTLLAAGDTVTVLHPFPATVVQVRADEAGTVGLGLTPVRSPVRPPGVLPAGTIFATLDDRVRAPTALDQPAAPDGTLGDLLVRDLTPGTPLVLAPPEPGRPALLVSVQQVAPVADQVHLDPYVFAYSAGHRIRISAT